MVCQIGTRSNTNVVHIDSYSSSKRLVFEDGVAINKIHHRLEGCWGIGKTEVHYRWFEKPISGFKGCFVFVAFTNTDIIIPPPYVELCVNVCVAQISY